MKPVFIGQPQKVPCKCESVKTIGGKKQYICTTASLPKNIYSGRCDSSGNCLLFHGLNIYKDLFTSVSMLVNFSSNLVSPLRPLVSIYNSQSLGYCSILCFLCPFSTYLLNLYCINLRMFIYCLRFLNLCIFPSGVLCMALHSNA